MTVGRLTKSAPLAPSSITAPGGAGPEAWAQLVEFVENVWPPPVRAWGPRLLSELQDRCILIAGNSRELVDRPRNRPVHVVGSRPRYGMDWRNGPKPGTFWANRAVVWKMSVKNWIWGRSSG